MKRTIFRVFVMVAIMMGNPNTGRTQGMAINSSGTPANASAMLDVSSTTQGMLVPRMLAAQRTAISSPATGLLVYQTDGTTGFYFYDGSTWTSLSGGGGSPTGSAGGDLTGTYPNPTLTTTGVSAATWGSGGTQVATITTDAKGRVTGASNTAIANLNTSVLTAGTIATARLGSGTASTATFLRGDNTWVAPSGGGVQQFYGNLTSNLSLTVSTTTKANFSNAAVNLSSQMSSGTFTAAATGYYLVSCQFVNTGTTAPSLFPSIRVNGTAMYYGWSSTQSGAYGTLGIGIFTHTIFLTSGDTLEAYIMTGFAAGATVSSGGSTYLSIYKL